MKPFFFVAAVLFSMMTSLPINAQDISGETIQKIAWSPDSTKIAYASYHGGIRIVSADDNTPLLTIPLYETYAVLLSWSPDGERIAAATQDEKAYIWDSATGTPQLEIDLSHQQEFASTLMWSQDGKQIITSWTATNIPAQLQYWDVTNGSLVFETSIEGNGQGEWNPTGAQIAFPTGTAMVIMNAVRPQNVDRVNLWGDLGGYYYPTTLDWSPVGNRLIVGFFNGAALVYDVDEHRTMSSLPPRSGLVEIPLAYDVAFSTDGSTAASMTKDGVLTLFNPETGAILSEEHLAQEIASAAFSPDKTRVAYAVVGLSDISVTTTMPSYNLEIPRVFDAKWSHNNRWIAESLFGGAIRIRDASTWEVIKTLPAPDMYGNNVAWNSDDSLLVGAGTGTINVWNPATGEMTDTIRGHEASIVSVTWNGDDTAILTTTEGDGIGSLYLWNPFDGILFASSPIGAALDAALSPDESKFALAALSGAIAFVDASDLTLETILYIARQYDFESEWTAYRVVWHPSGHLAATGHVNGDVRVWDVDNEALLQTLTGTASPFKGGNTVRGLRFSADGSHLISVNGEGLIKVWETTNWTLVAEAAVGAPVTGADWNDQGALVVATDTTSSHRITLPEFE